MAVEWKEAPQSVIDIAQRIIKAHHPHLMEVDIALIMRSEAPVTNGVTTLGKARKVSAEQQVHIPYDFIIWIAQDEWHRLTQKQKEALIDHELSHCGWDGLNKHIIAHDVEEFAHIIERHGLWKPSLNRFAKAVQGALPIEKREGSVGTLDFINDDFANEVEQSMRADGMDVEVNVVPATSRSE